LPQSRLAGQFLQVRLELPALCGFAGGRSQNRGTAKYAQIADGAIRSDDACRKTEPSTCICRPSSGYVGSFGCGAEVFCKVTRCEASVAGARRAVFESTEPPGIQLFPDCSEACCWLICRLPLRLRARNHVAGYCDGRIRCSRLSRALGRGDVLRRFRSWHYRGSLSLFHAAGNPLRRGFLGDRGVRYQRTTIHGCLPRLRRERPRAESTRRTSGCARPGKRHPPNSCQLLVFASALAFRFCCRALLKMKRSRAADNSTTAHW